MPWRHFHSSLQGSARENYLDKAVRALAFGLGDELLDESLLVAESQSVGAVDGKWWARKGEGVS